MAPGQVENAVGRKCASGCHIPGDEGLAGFGKGFTSLKF